MQAAQLCNLATFTSQLNDYSATHFWYFQWEALLWSCCSHQFQFRLTRWNNEDQCLFPDDSSAWETHVRCREKKCCFRHHDWQQHFYSKGILFTYTTCMSRQDGQLCNLVTPSIPSPYTFPMAVKMHTNIPCHTPRIYNLMIPSIQFNAYSRHTLCHFQFEALTHSNACQHAYQYPMPHSTYIQCVCNLTTPLMQFNAYLCHTLLVFLMQSPYTFQCLTKCIPSHAT